MFSFVPNPGAPINPIQSNPVLPAKKRAGKAAELASLVGQLVGDSRALGRKAVSKRELLATNKVDISWMDLCYWSPAINRELKRLLVRKSNEKARKAKKKKVTFDLDANAASASATTGPNRTVISIDHQINHLSQIQTNPDLLSRDSDVQARVRETIDELRGLRAMK